MTAKAYSPDVNSVKISSRDNCKYQACWNMDIDFMKNILDQEGLELHSHDFKLRLFEAGDFLRYHDINVDKTNGCCSLYLQPERAYYVSFGILHRTKFIPILSSDTIMKYA